MLFEIPHGAVDRLRDRNFLKTSGDGNRSLTGAIFFCPQRGSCVGQEPCLNKPKGVHF